MNKINHHNPKATAKIPPWLLSFDDAIYEQTIAGLNRDTVNNSTLANLYEQDKAAIQTGFDIGRNLGQNFNSFMDIMVKDMDKAGKQPAKDASGNPILDASGKPMTVKQAYDQGYEVAPVTVDGQTINYATRQQLWDTGGTGNILATAVVGAFSGNVTGGASELIKNTAINVVRAYGATEIKAIADGFKNPDGSTNGTSETVRGLLHAIAGCAGASATGGDCASAAVASGGTVAMNNAMGALLNLDPSTMTEEQKQAYSNLMGTLVSGVTSAVGGDTAAAQLATKVEEDNNDLLTTPDGKVFSSNSTVGKQKGYNKIAIVQRKIVKKTIYDHVTKNTKTEDKEEYIVEDTYDAYTLGIKPTDKERLEQAKDSYNDQSQGVSGGWSVKPNSDFHDQRTGADYRVYQRLGIDGKMYYVVATAGSLPKNGAVDFYVDRDQTLGKIPEQYTQTVSGVIDLKLPVSRTEAVGHSLGCGTGSAYGLATGSNVTCFSGAALHPNSIQYFSGQNAGQQPIIRNYAIQGEIVTSGQNFLNLSVPNTTVLRKPDRMPVSPSSTLNNAVHSILNHSIDSVGDQLFKPNVLEENK